MATNNGTKLCELSPDEKQRLGLSYGVKVLGPISGILTESRLNEGFIITKIDGKILGSLEQLERQLRKKDGIMIEGIYPDGTYDRYYTRGFQV